MRKPTLLQTEPPAFTTLGADTRLPETIAGRTRRVYDALAEIYPLSTWCFHSRAHKVALELSGVRNGMRVLELATGSGEMFRRLVEVNPAGTTVGVDLSPKMALKTLRQVRSEFPGAQAHCQAVDARYLPFASESFDAVVCCYLLELMSTEDALRALAETQRVLRPRGTFTLILIGQNAEFFNQLYKMASSVAPAFWGRQIDARVPELMKASEFRICAERTVRQSGYPSRVILARKTL
jgi:ubiquinone/menaquinone biosynthesis C-methylase UbiE